MNHCRCTMSAVGSPDCRFIYVMGGYDGGALNLVERYDILTDKWEFVAPMRTKRFMHSSIIISFKNQIESSRSSNIF